MTKYSLIVLFFVCFHSLSSQIALRGGLNYSKVNVDGEGVAFGPDSKIGYHLGLQGAISLGGLNLRPALLFHVKGGKEADNGSLGNTNLKYLELPLNLSVNIGVEKLRLILEAGPYFGYLLDTSSGFVDNIGDRLNKSDWGVNFGAVIELSGFAFGANYSNSLISIARVDDQLAQAFKTTNGNLSLFGYMKF